MLSPEQIEAIERDAGAGLSISQIQKKHNIAYETAKRYAPDASSQRGKRRAGGGEMPLLKPEETARAAANLRPLFLLYGKSAIASTSSSKSWSN
jgi:hypothetical protein